MKHGLRHLVGLLLLVVGMAVGTTPCALAAPTAPGPEGLWNTGTLTQTSPFGPGAQPAGPVVRAVLYWRQDCPNCEKVETEVLPPLQAQYGAQLEIQQLEVTAANLEQFYQVAAAYGIAKTQAGVPLLLIGDRALLGAQQIPAELPGLIERYLAAGGVDYPQPGGLVLVTPTGEASVCLPEVPCETPTPVPQPGLISEGFEVAYGVLALLVVALLYALVRGGQWLVTPVRPPARWVQMVFPLLILAGLGVAGYLAYAETQAVPAICGPIGDCNSVQESAYALLFGFLPVAVLGLLGYVGLGAAWAFITYGRGPLRRWAQGALLGMALFGVGFSIYLTGLELFVIHAVCSWCLTSAVIMAILLVLSVELAGEVLQRQGRRASMAEVG